ncbi:probable calcium-binding protein CML18 [Primulina huaijiensis]|uniref:probable calcium-binding protein CML18 n=1 Tax=Primulina huaijiensis TaxID=1492673 RepID=UPI003CC7191C
MEMSSQLQQVFKLIDTNGDGKISPLELQQVVFSLRDENSMAATELAQRMVKEMDFDGDGFVSLDEFMRVMQNSSENEDSGCGFCEESSFMEVFMVFDDDNNGLISARELQRVLGRLGFGKCRIRECRKMIQGVDKDGDGCKNIANIMFDLID